MNKEAIEEPPKAIMSGKADQIALAGRCVAELRRLDGLKLPSLIRLKMERPSGYQKAADEELLCCPIYTDPERAALGAIMHRHIEAGLLEYTAWLTKTAGLDKGELPL